MASSSIQISWLNFLKLTLTESSILTGNPSLQTSAVANSTPHIPVVFIKQEPVDLELGTQCLYSVNNHVVGPSQRQSAFIFHPGSAMTSVGPNSLPVQAISGSAGQQGCPLLQNLVPVHPSQSPQPNRHGFQGATALTGREPTSAVSIQPTAAMPLENTQTPTSIRGQVQVQRGNESQPGRQELQQSAGQQEKRKATIEEMAAETLNTLDGNYKTGKVLFAVCFTYWQFHPTLRKILLILFNLWLTNWLT